MKINLLKQAKYRDLFLITALSIFIILGSLLLAFNLVPSQLASSGNERNVGAEPSPEPAYAEDVFPTRIAIASVGIDTTVERPQSQNVETLDAALLKGAVYYPGSGSLVRGNAFFFGHSTGITVVRNQAYKAFNNLKNVQAGDEIRVYGEDGNIYVYSAVSTELVTEDSTLVEFDTTERMITLSTCNTFGKKEERHVVKAIFDRVELAS
jgi:LPXTG-site transpeptidase (sortase) family protein